MTVCLPGESFAAVRADVGFLYAALVGAHVVTHAVLSLEALLANGTGERLLVRVGQAVAVEMVHVPEGLPTRLAGVVLLHGDWVWVSRPLRRNRQAAEFRSGSVSCSGVNLFTRSGPLPLMLVLTGTHANTGN